MWRPAVISLDPSGKRQMLDGRQRWPHTQKLLETTCIDGQALPDILKDSRGMVWRHLHLDKKYICVAERQRWEEKAF